MGDEFFEIAEDIAGNITRDIGQLGIEEFGPELGEDFFEGLDDLYQSQWEDVPIETSEVDDISSLDIDHESFKPPNLKLGPSPPMLMAPAKTEDRIIIEGLLGDNYISNDKYVLKSYDSIGGKIYFKATKQGLGERVFGVKSSGRGISSKSFSIGDGETLEQFATRIKKELPEPVVSIGDFRAPQQSLEVIAEELPAPELGRAEIELPEIQRRVIEPISVIPHVDTDEVLDVSRAFRFHEDPSAPKNMVQRLREFVGLDNPEYSELNLFDVDLVERDGIEMGNLGPLDVEPELGEFQPMEIEDANIQRDRYTSAIVNWWNNLSREQLTSVLSRVFNRYTAVALVTIGIFSIPFIIAATRRYSVNRDPKDNIPPPIYPQPEGPIVIPVGDDDDDDSPDDSPDDSLDDSVDDSGDSGDSGGSDSKEIPLDDWDKWIKLFNRNSNFDFWFMIFLLIVILYIIKK